MMLVLACVLHVEIGIGSLSMQTWSILGGCTLLACILEAITSQIDNLFLPLFYQTALLIAAIMSD